jgi:anaerobic carbon-monoxide dehydrogenase iron sulfur subunit
MPSIIANSDKCGGCDTCMLVCAVKNFKVNNKSKAAIKTKSLFPNPGRNEVEVCKQTECVGQPCIEACPTGAIAKNANGIVDVDKEKCIKCLACSQACPNGAIFAHKDIPHIIHCNLCNGNPECVKWCPTHAIEYKA